MGVRPISNVVDCTNYVMLELGNPLHAFDRRFLRGGVLRIRRAAEGEAMTTLDGRAHALRADDLLIADAEGGVALAGVMGGANSEVRDDTASLFLESAHFDPETVRRTAARLRMTSESSHRFSRGVDPELPGRALARLIELLEQTAGAQLLGELVDLYPEPVARPPVTLRPERIRGLLGMEIPPGRVLDLLRRAGLDAEEHAQDGALRVRVQAPSYRFDIEREVDVLEELARLQGYDSIPETPPSRPLRAVPRQAAGHDLGRIRSTLASLGLSECIHFSFVDRGWMEALGLPAAHPWLARTVRIGNPLSEVGGILRPTLLGSLLRAAARNRNAGADDVRLFELRNTFLLREDGFAAVEASGHGGPSPAIERRCVAGVLMGRRNAPGWAADGSALDFADLKALAEALEAVVQWRGFRWDSNNIPAFLDAREAAVLVRAGAVAAGDPLAEPPGWLGRIAAPVLQAFELDAVAWAFEIDLDAVTPKKRADLRFQPFSRFPGASRDLAFVVPDAIPSDLILQDAEKAARKAAGAAFTGVRVFDVYRGKGVADGHRSIALRLSFRSLERTLADAEVDAATAQVESRLSQRDGVALRR
jgi:phenylalanyl-tRNA synthetase beta chain